MGPSPEELRVKLRETRPSQEARPVQTREDRIGHA